MVETKNLVESQPTANLQGFHEGDGSLYTSKPPKFSDKPGNRAWFCQNVHNWGFYHIWKTFIRKNIFFYILKKSIGKKLLWKKIKKVLEKQIFWKKVLEKNYFAKKYWKKLILIILQKSIAKSILQNRNQKP